MNTVSIEIPSAENSVREVEQVRHRKFWKPLLSTAVAAVAAVGMGMGANAALAAPTEISGYHHVDYVSLNYDADNDAIELGSNLNDSEWVPAGTYSIAVPWSSPVPNTADTEGTGYIIPEIKNNAIYRNVPWVGFSGDESTWGLQESGTTSATITLDNVCFVPVGGNSCTSGGSFTASQDGQTWFSSNGGTHTFPFDGESDEESFHEHTKWEFSTPGTYTLTFSAEAGVLTAPAKDYTFNVGL